jgi:hypothetical protein
MAKRENRRGCLFIFILLLLGTYTAAANTGDRIVFVGADDNIYLLDPVSREVSPVTRDAVSSRSGATVYRYPTWSRSGELAFVRYESLPDGRQRAAIGRYREGEPLRIADRLGGVSPFYLYYSPDGGYLSALGNRSEQEGLGFILLRESNRDARLAATGQPFYWTWIKGTDRLLVHSGGITPKDEIFFLSARRATTNPVPVIPGFFQAPAVSYDSELAAVAVRDGNGSRLVIANRDMNTLLQLPLHSGMYAFDWSPTSNKLAFVEGQFTPLGFQVGTLKIVTADTPNNLAVAETGIEIAGPFFWSPNGRYIAVFQPRISDSPSGRILAMAIIIYDVRNAAQKEIVRYIPEPLFISQVAPFFDQYQRSATIWSPDSTRIVISAATAAGNPGIFILGIGEESEIPIDVPEGSRPVVFRRVRQDEEIVPGTYPFWSWQ